MELFAKCMAKGSYPQHIKSFYKSIKINDSVDKEAKDIKKQLAGGHDISAMTGLVVLMLIPPTAKQQKQ